MNADAFREGQAKTNSTRLQMPIIILVCVTGLAIIGFSGYGVYRAMQGDGGVQYQKTAEASYQANDLPKAEEYFFKAAKATRKRFGENSTQYITALRQLGWLYAEEGKYAEARKMIAKVQNWSSGKQMQFKTAQLLAYAGTKSFEKSAEEKTPADWYRSQAKLREGIAALTPFLGKEDPGLLKLYSDLEKCSMALGDYQSAEECLLNTATIRDHSFGSDSIAAADNRMKLGDLYLAWGNRLRGREMLHDAAKLFTDARTNYGRARGPYSRLVGSACPQIALAEKKEIECGKLLGSLPRDFASGTTVALSSGQLPPFEP